MFRRLWSWIGVNDVQIKLVFALIGAAYVIFQYNAHVINTRVERAVTHWKEAHKGEFYEIANALNQFYTSDKYKKWSKTTTHETYHQDLIEELAAQSLNNNVYSLLGVYGGIAICAKSNLCDGETSCALFFEEIQGFRENYRGHLITWEENLGDHSGRDIEFFAEQICKDRFKAYCDEVKQSPDCNGSSTENK